ncbi:MAG: hypothetical protein Q7S52_00235 [bacterium]|nr:hypothetical protein [bacterium]
MGLRGPKPKGKAKRIWSAELAYAVGLLATDGCLSGDGRHIDLTSQDKEQLKNFMKCIGVTHKISQKRSGYTEKLQTRVQFSDVLFYQFLVDAGLTPAKSKTIGPLAIPPKYFFDFLRGAFDGDGCFYSYFDQRWKSSFMYYLVFTSASMAHIEWIRGKLRNSLGVNGHITFGGQHASVYNLKYAKKEALKILKKMYKEKKCVRLTRKWKKVKKALQINGEVL